MMFKKWVLLIMILVLLAVLQYAVILIWRHIITSLLVKFL